VKILKLFVKIILNLILFGSAIYYGYNRFEEYINNPWTRDGQVRAQVIQVSPRVTGMVTNISIIDNQFVKKGDLLLR